MTALGFFFTLKVLPEVVRAAREAGVHVVGGTLMWIMSQLTVMRALLNQMLTTAVETLFVEFQKTLSEYENEICRLKEENDCKCKLFDTVLEPVVHVHKAGGYALVIRLDLRLC